MTQKGFLSTHENKRLTSWLPEHPSIISEHLIKANIDSRWVWRCFSILNTKLVLLPVLSLQGQLWVFSTSYSHDSNFALYTSFSLWNLFTLRFDRNPLKHWTLTSGLSVIHRSQSSSQVNYCRWTWWSGSQCMFEVIQKHDSKSSSWFDHVTHSSVF